MSLSGLPDEMITEITNYFSSYKEVFNFLLINKEIYDFMVDKNGKIKDYYGHCCCNVINPCVVVSDKECLKSLNKHYIREIKMKQFVISDIDVEKYCLCKDYDESEIVSLKGRIDCFKNNQLSSLKLECANIFDDDLKYFSNLKSLDIKSCCMMISNDGLKYLTKLKELHLANNQIIDDSGLRHLSNILTLSIIGCKNITNQGFQYLRNIRYLDVSYNSDKIDDSGLMILSKTSLHSLIMKNNRRITDKGLKYLPKSLVLLDLTHNNSITDKGIGHISNIQSLTIGTGLTDAGLKMLKNIQYLNVVDPGNNITNVGKQYISGTIKKLVIQKY